MRLGRYEVIARLAQGGMGEIFLARLEGAAGFAKLFAIKRILPQFASDPRFRKMLIGEAQIASKMAHANICQVYELGENDGQLYIVMEYLEGVSLLPLLRACSRQHRVLELGFVAAVLLQVCDALHYAHELRDRDGRSLDVIHRDVTLANVFVCESGSAKVLDFGIAKVKNAPGAQTQGGEVKGKYAYMAPEQLRGEELTRRVDVFALGVVAYEMLALRRLFQRQTDYLTFHAVLEQPIADLRRYRSDLPDELVAVIGQALQRDPAQRFPTIRAMGTAIADALGSRRPWTQDQVGALVTELFADEIRIRQAAVARAIAAPSTEVDGPPIASNAAPDDDDEQGFPSVETELGQISNEVRTVVERLAQRQAEPVSQPDTPVPVAARPARTWPWIVAVLVLLAGGGGALAFVMLHEPQPTEIIIERGDADTREADTKSVMAFDKQLIACAQRFPSTHNLTVAEIEIDASGRMREARFHEHDVDTGPLGDCLRSAFAEVAFASSNDSRTLKLELTLPAKKR